MHHYILCYGDSNTWGQSAGDAARYTFETRWPGLLERGLRENVRVIEEGLSGRTTVWDDPLSGPVNGHSYLLPCLLSHRPLSLIILMLGTNDLKARFSLTPLDIARGVGVLLNTVKASQAGADSMPPPILLVCPPPLGSLSGTAAVSFMGGGEKSLELDPYYEAISIEYGCAYLNAGAVTRIDGADGVHLTPENHRALGSALIQEVERKFPSLSRY